MNIGYSFLLTTLSGFSTLLGMAVILFKFKNINKIIVSSLSFASGVMICVSILDLLPESLKLFNEDFNIFVSILLFLIFLIIGMITTLTINKLLPENDNLYKVGIISMLAIILHNIPEGILTLITSMVNKKLGLSLAFSLAMHNIPEGISISVPIYYSTKSKGKAFLYTFVSAISEPFGAVIAYLFLRNIVNSLFIGILFSLVTGIMIYISIFELIPQAKKYNENKLLYTFFVIGILFMLISLSI